MNCINHPDREIVSQCGNCGAGLCKECDENAYFRTNEGRGQALCNRCSLQTAEEAVAFQKKWLRKRMIKLIICAVFVITGIISFSVYSEKGDYESAFISTIILWAIAGVIANIGLKKDTDVKDQIFAFKHPFANFMSKFVGYTLLGPIMIITGFIGYMRTMFNYKKDIKIRDLIKKDMEESSNN